MFDQEYLKEMMSELIDEERHYMAESEALRIFEDAVDIVGASISDSGGCEITIKDGIEKHPVVVSTMAILEAKLLNAHKERYLRLEQMKIQDRQATALERIEKRLGNISATLEAVQEGNSDAVTTYDVANLNGQLEKTGGDISSNLYTLSKDIFTLRNRIEDLTNEIRGKKK